MGNGRSIRDFAFSRDVARAILLTCIKGTKKFEFLNIGSGKAVSIKKLVNTLKSIVIFKEKYDGVQSKGFRKEF